MDEEQANMGQNQRPKGLKFPLTKIVGLGV